MSEIVRLAPPTETFGHVPLRINEGYCGGCNVCGSREEMVICARCRILVNVNAYTGRQPAWSFEEVQWPCGTAVVLNLVDEWGELRAQFRPVAAVTS